MYRPIFATDEVYHIYNRGVEKRDIFLDDQDHFRFIHDLFEFNDQNPAKNINFNPNNEGVHTRERRPRERLVDIIAFCLMPNHYHLIVRQRTEGGITNFMRKLGTGYTNYFNVRYDREGVLFQGKFKAIHITNESHFLYLPHYIHLNPLDLFMPEWREQKIKDVQQAIEYLEKYRWSSFNDYIGNKNYPSVLNYGSPTSIVGYKNEIIEWLRSFTGTDILNDISQNSIKDVVIE